MDESFIGTSIQFSEQEILRLEAEYEKKRNEEVQELIDSGYLSDFEEGEWIKYDNNSSSDEENEDNTNNNEIIEHEIINKSPKSRINELSRSEITLSPDSNSTVENAIINDNIELLDDENTNFISFICNLLNNWYVLILSLLIIQLFTTIMLNGDNINNNMNDITRMTDSNNYLLGYDEYIYQCNTPIITINTSRTSNISNINIHHVTTTLHIVYPHRITSTNIMNIPSKKQECNKKYRNIKVISTIKPQIKLLMLKPFIFMQEISPPKILHLVPLLHIRYNKLSR